MENRINKLLFDILTSINNIESYIGDERLFAQLLAAAAPPPIGGDGGGAPIPGRLCLECAGASVAGRRHPRILY